VIEIKQFFAAGKKNHFFVQLSVDLGGGFSHYI